MSVLGDTIARAAPGVHYEPAVYGAHETLNHGGKGTVLEGKNNDAVLVDKDNAVLGDKNDDTVLVGENDEVQNDVQGTGLAHNHNGGDAAVVG